MTHENTTEPSDHFDIISVYTRAQAIADGVLVDCSSLATEAGFRVPVAVTSAVHETLDPSSEEIAEGQSLEGRFWDVLMMLRLHAAGESTVFFQVLVSRTNVRVPLQLRAEIGPGDDGEPVITIMLPHED